ncbi:unnamed protein product [Amaranthus hypochondriacus]
MESEDSSSLQQGKNTVVQTSAPANGIVGQGDSANPSPATSSASGIFSWAKSLRIPQASGEAEGQSQTGSGARSSFARLTSGLGLSLSASTPMADGNTSADTTSQTGVFNSLTKGLVGSSRNAVKAVQVKARHLVSQNKRRYQEGGFDLDLTYITDNIIAMGFPAGDMSSGIFGYVEGFYRNHMEEVIRFFETRHQGKYKVYNLCSERLYDASLFQGKAASFPFDDHNCPPIHLISSFCESACTWLKADVENVVVVHCKAGLGRTGLMISSLLLYMKFCHTAEESIDLFNKRRCVDGKGLVLPSQIRYVKYFEQTLKDYNGDIPPGRRCMLRGFRLHKCPYWIRPSITISDHNGIIFTTKKHPKTKDLLPEDFWLNSTRKGIVVFALPREPGLTELVGDYRIHFQDRNGDFYCWFNTTLTENKIIINSDDLDGFDKRKLPSPTFQIEIVMVDYDGTLPKTSNPEQVKPKPDSSSEYTASRNGIGITINPKESSEKEENDNVFSDSDGEDGSSRTKHSQASVAGSASNNQVSSMTQRTQQMSIAESAPKIEEISNVETPKLSQSTPTDFKAIAADASVFSFGDEDFESD